MNTFRYRAKGRTFMTALMEKEYNIEFQRLIKRLQTIQFIAFTADGWESKNNNRSFIRLV